MVIPSPVADFWKWQTPRTQQLERGTSPFAQEARREAVREYMRVAVRSAFQGLLEPFNTVANNALESVVFKAKYNQTAPRLPSSIRNFLASIDLKDVTELESKKVYQVFGTAISGNELKKAFPEGFDFATYLSHGIVGMPPDNLEVSESVKSVLIGFGDARMPPRREFEESDNVLGNLITKGAGLLGKGIEGFQAVEEPIVEGILKMAAASGPLGLSSSGPLLSLENAEAQVELQRLYEEVGTGIRTRDFDRIRNVGLSLQEDFRDRPVWVQIATSVIAEAPLPFLGFRSLSSFRALKAAKVPVNNLRIVEATGGITKTGRWGLHITPELISMRDKQVYDAVTRSGGLDPGISFNFFAPEMRTLEEAAAEVVSVKNPIIRKTLGSGPLPINPSVAADNPLMKGIFGYAKQRVAAKELTRVTLAAGVDAFAKRFTGTFDHILRFDTSGEFLSEAVVKAKEAGRKSHWLDVFENPGQYEFIGENGSKLSEFIEVYRHTIQEVNNLRAAEGLRLFNPNKVNRQVREIAGLATDRPSNPFLERVYDLAEEGFSGPNQVRYYGPRETLRLTIQGTYDEIANAQLKRYIEPYTYTPSKLMEKMQPELVARHRQVVEDLNLATKAQLLIKSDIRKTKVDRRFLRVLIKDEEKLSKHLSDTLDWLDSKMPPGVRPKRVKGFAETKKKLMTGYRKAGVKLQKNQELLTNIDYRLEFYDGQAQLYGERLGLLKRDFNAVNQKYKNTLAATRETQVVKNVFKEGAETVKEWRGRFMPESAEKALLDATGMFRKDEVTGSVSQFFQKFGNIVRFFGAGADLALPLIHGLPVFAYKPNEWARGTALHFEAFFDPTVQSRFIQEHMSTFRKMARNGVPVGDPETFQMLERGEGFEFFGKIIERLGGRGSRILAQKAGRQTFGRFQAAYNAGLDGYRALIWESLEPSWRGTEGQLAQHIKNLTGGLNAKALGISAKQAGWESTWLAFSPRLFRSTLAMAAELRNPSSATGREAYIALSRLASVIPGLYIMSGFALGKDWETIRGGLDPIKGKQFLAHEINGDWIGVGGQYRALMQLLARSAIAIKDGEPQQLVEVDLYDNPIISYLSTRGAPAARTAAALAEAATGHDFLPFDKVDSLPDLGKHLAFSALPFAIQGYVEGEKLTPTSVAGFLGFRTSPETPFEAKARTRTEIAQTIPEIVAKQDNLGFTYDDLEIDDQALVNDILERDYPNIVSEAEDRSRELGGPVQPYLDSIRTRNESFRNEVAVRAEGVNRDDPVSMARFRTWYSDSQAQLAAAKDQIRMEHPKAIEELEALDKNKKPLEIALDDYLDTLNDSELEDSSTGEYDFAERDRRLSALTVKYGPSMIKRIEDFLSRNDHPLVTELKRDRDSLETYFAIKDRVWEAVIQLEPSLAKYETYNKYREAARQYLAENGAQVWDIERLVDGMLVAKKVNEAITKERVKWLRANPEKADTIAKWSYTGPFQSAFRPAPTAPIRTSRILSERLSKGSLTGR